MIAGITFHIKYYRDVWADETCRRRARHHAKAGEITALSKLVEHYGFDQATYAVISVDGKPVASYNRDIETLSWKIES